MLERDLQIVFIVRQSNNKGNQQEQSFSVSNRQIITKGKQIGMSVKQYEDKRETVTLSVSNVWTTSECNNADRRKKELLLLKSRKHKINVRLNKERKTSKR